MLGLFHVLNAFWVEKFKKKKEERNDEAMWRVAAEMSSSN